MCCVPLLSAHVAKMKFRIVDIGGGVCLGIVIFRGMYAREATAHRSILGGMDVFSRGIGRS